MKVIETLVDKIDEELHDAKSYIKLACENKEEYPSLANVYYKLSLEEMNHATVLHDQVVSIINDIKRTKEVPAGMQALYDYLHNKQIKKAAKIKSMQDSYK